MNKLQLNIYLQRNSRACMVFKRNGILYRINNLTEPMEFVRQMQDISKTLKTGTMEDHFLELSDHRGKVWVLECGPLEGKIQLAVWFQNKTELKHYDARFSWQGTAEEFRTAVHYLAVANDVQRVFRIYRKG